MKKIPLRAMPPPAARDGELAWRLACLAADTPKGGGDAARMASWRVLDSYGVAIGGIADKTVATMRRQALRRTDPSGALLFGSTARVAPEEAAWANGAALRLRDMHDMFVAAEYAHPSDAIPALMAVAQSCGLDGAALMRGIVASYEIQIALSKAISLNRHGIEPIGHLAPSIAGGIGAMLDLPTETIHAAIEHAVHLCVFARRTPVGRKSDWRVVCAPMVAKRAVEAVGLAQDGLLAPSPAYEGPQGLFARFLGGTDFAAEIEIPEAADCGQALRVSFPKVHEAQYQSQAMIDLALRLRNAIPDWRDVAKIEILTSQHIHRATGTAWRVGAAPRPRLDHDLSLIVASIFATGGLAKPRDADFAARPEIVWLTDRIATIAEDSWSARSHLDDPARQSFGGTVHVVRADGSEHTETIEWADRHPNRGQPWGERDYVARFADLAAPFAASNEIEDFIERCLRLATLDATAIWNFNLKAAPGPSAI